MSLAVEIHKSNNCQNDSRDYESELLTIDIIMHLLLH